MVWFILFDYLDQVFAVFQGIQDVGLRGTVHGLGLDVIVQGREGQFSELAQVLGSCVPGSCGSSASAGERSMDSTKDQASRMSFFSSGGRGEVSMW
jgi:hypothetical protein